MSSDDTYPPVIAANRENKIAFAALVEALDSPEGIVPYVGPGAVADLQFPSWSAFVKRLAKELSISEAQPYEDIAAQLLEQAAPGFIEDEIRIEYGLDKLELRSEPLPVELSLLPSLAGDWIITDNIDRSVEFAFEQADQPCQAAWESSDLTTLFLRGPTTRPTLVKLRGDVYAKSPRFVLPSAFDKYLLGALGTPRKLLESLLRTHTMLFIGAEPPLSAVVTLAAGAAAIAPAGARPPAHYCLLHESWQSAESVRTLQLARIRPLWYAAPFQLHDVLFDLAQRSALARLGRGPASPVVVAAPPRRSPDSPPRPVADRAATLPAPAVPIDLIDACAAHECVAFVGSGLAARAGLPTWAQFVEGMIDEAVRAGLVTPERAQWQLLALADGEVNAVADNIVSAFSRQRERLQNYCVRASTFDGPLPKAFELLAALPFAGLLTTNYDTLLERAFAIEPLTSQDGERLLERLASRAPFLLKLYGDLTRPDTVLLGPEDYQNLVRSDAALGRFIEALFFSHTLLFVGTSLEGLTDYLSAFTFPSGVPRRHYALVAVSGHSWPAKAELLKRRYNIDVLPFEATDGYPEVDTFLDDLRRRVAARLAVAAQPESAAATGPQLRKVCLKDIGPFKSLELAFDDHWTVLLGDNGVGKSTILKGIAVAIVGSEGRHVAGRLLRAGEPLGTVSISTARNPSGYVADIQRVGASAEVVSHGGRSLEAENWIAMGFPPLRTSSWKSPKGPQTMMTRRPSADDVLPLLASEPDARADDLKQWLVNTEATANNALLPEPDRTRATAMRRKFFEIIRALTDDPVLDLAEVTADFRVMVHTRDGIVPIESLSQGMSSLLSWIGILLQRLYEVHYDSDGDTDPTAEYALVLMDEIDAHMHPSWQQTLVTRVKQIFPRIQVIASTHSPLVVGGLPTTQVVRLVREDDAIVVAPIDPDMTLGRADQILTGDLFGLDTTLALGEETTALVKEYETLLATSTRTPEQESRYVHLHRLLDGRVPSAGIESKLERRAVELVDAILNADYAPEQVDALRRDLVSAARRVMQSMGWTNVREPAR